MTKGSNAKCLLFQHEGESILLAPASCGTWGQRQEQWCVVTVTGAPPPPKPMQPRDPGKGALL